MSGRVCYLRRSDRGDRLDAVHLVSARTDEAWSPRAAGKDGEETPVETLRAAAEWVASSLAAHKSRRLAAVCLDTAGSACSWLTAPSDAPAVVRAAFAQHARGFGIDAEEESPSSASVQTLVTGSAGLAAEGEPMRLAALHTRDAAAGVFLDRLDEKGVAADTVISIWHALAAWDPAPARPAQGDDNFVATSSPVTGIVLIEPEGRLFWAWTRAGRLITAGSARTPVDTTLNGTEKHSARLTRELAARLTSDWLAWAAQLGLAPARLALIGPPTKADETSLSAQAFGQLLGSSWTGATIDVAVHDDPVGMTLRRLAEDTPDAPELTGDKALRSLAHRPGRAHRSMFVWASGSLVAVGCIVLVGAVRLWAAAGEAQAEKTRVEGEMKAEIVRVDPDSAKAAWPGGALDSKIAELRKANAVPETFAPPKPILRELDNIATVLGSNVKDEAFEGLRLRRIDISHAMAQIDIEVPTQPAAENMVVYLGNVDSDLSWQASYEEIRGLDGDWTKAIISGRWVTPSKATGTP